MSRKRMSKGSKGTPTWRPWYEGLWMEKLGEPKCHICHGEQQTHLGCLKRVLSIHPDSFLWGTLICDAVLMQALKTCFLLLKVAFNWRHLERSSEWLPPWSLAYDLVRDYTLFSSRPAASKAKPEVLSNSRMENSDLQGKWYSSLSLIND